MDPEYVETLLAQMFMQAKMQFGGAIKGYWFYEDDPCPGCGGKIDETKFKGERAISLNAYIYRPRGMLIGYFLCHRCANTVIKAKKEGSLHKKIEETLNRAYLKHLH